MGAIDAGRAGLLARMETALRGAGLEVHRRGGDLLDLPAVADDAD